MCRCRDGLLVFSNVENENDKYEAYTAALTYGKKVVLTRILRLLIEIVLTCVDTITAQIASCGMLLVNLA